MSSDNGYLPDHYVYIKCRFKSSSRNLYGLILLSFTPNGALDSYQVISSTYSEIYQIDQQAPWNEYEEVIVQTKWSGKYNQNVTRDLQMQIESLVEDSFHKTQLFESANDYDYGTVEQILYDTVKRVIQDKNLKIDLDIQEVTEEEIVEVKQKREQDRMQKYAKQEEISSSDTFNIDEGSIVLRATLILSPVKGKPMSEIRLGDRIMVKIDSSSKLGQHYIDYYNLRDDNIIKPLPVQIIDIKATSKTDPIQLLMMVEQGVYCICTEEERQVKLRMFDPVSDRPIRDLKQNTKLRQPSTVSKPDKNSDNSNITVILSVALVLLLMVLIAVVYLIFII